MIRILHTACAGLLLIVALLAYGVKEEVGALRRDVATLERERDAVAEAIALERAEWAYLNSPGVLRRVADRLYGEGRLVGPEGEILAPWRPEQLIEIRDLPVRPQSARAAEPALRGGTLQ